MADASVVSCGQCAQRNWVPARWDLKALACTHCGLGLTTGKAQRGGSGGRLFKIVGVLGLAVGGVLLLDAHGLRLSDLWRSAEPRYETPRTTYIPPANPAPPPKPAPTPAPPAPAPRAPAPIIVQPKVEPIFPVAVPIYSGVVRETRGKNRPFSLTIRGAANSNYFVKIVDSKTSEEISVLYVAGGGSVTAMMPTGVFQMRFATGATWYGESTMFGFPTQYWLANQLLYLNRGGKPMTLIISPNKGGFLKIQSIDGLRF